jgi:putative ABC transport system permease protein
MLMDTLLRDLRFGLRMLHKSPGFSALVVLTFALGIGVNTTIFSVVDAVAFRPLAVAAPDRVVRVLNTDPTHTDRGTASSWIEVQHLRTESQAFAGIAASDRRAVIVKHDDEARLLIANVVSDNYFDVFQVTPAVGRTFTPAEPRAPGVGPVVLLSYDFWQRQYNADRQIVGQTIIASDVACLVLGVLPRSFRGTEPFVSPEVYVPLSTWLMIAPGDRVRLERPQARQLEVFGRLRSGVTPAQAAAALMPVLQQLAAEFPQQESGRRLDVKFERDARGPQAKIIGGLLFGVAGLVLLIACVNIANLLLVRGEMRRLEIITRLALGASRHRTVRQLVTETLLLAIFGAAGAALLAGWAISLLPSLMPPMDFSVGFDFRLDSRVLWFGALISLLCFLLAGVLPAVATSDVALATAFKDVMGGLGRRGRWRDVMVIGQVAITVLLLIAAGLLVRTLIAVRDLDPGFDARGNMVIARLDVRKLTLPQEHTYYRTALDRLGAMPGIEAATVASRIPMWGSGGGAALLAWIPGLPEIDRDGVRIGFAVVSPNYFSTLGTRVVRGRAITSEDNESASLAVVLNQSAAHLLWPDEDAIGKHIRLNGPSGRDAEVVGIAQDGRYVELTEKQRAYMFLPLFQEARIFGSRWGADVVVVRTSADAAAQATAVRQALRTIDPNVLVLSMTTMDAHIRYALYGDRLTAQLVGSMGALGLILAAIGLFGVVSYSVTRRQREIGVRIALGANPRHVVRLVLVRALLLAGIGIAAGILLALASGRALSSMLFGVSDHDPFTFIASTATMVLVALLAAAIPARRAVSVDPIDALRAE